MKRGYFCVTDDGRVLALSESKISIEVARNNFNFETVEEPIPHLVEKEDPFFTHPSKWVFLLADSFEQASKDIHQIIAHKKSES